MFTKKITESDAFLDMPSSTQVLYFHLNMAADDDGFVNNPKKIQRMTGCSDDDMKLLIMKSFILIFESGVIVIKHWKMHNYIQSDRYKPTDYVDEKSTLQLKKNKAYTFAENENFKIEENSENDDKKAIEYEMDTNSVQDVSVGKDRLGKVRLGNKELCAFFETIWKLYPSKKGKGQVSDSAKKKLYDIGLEEMTRAIERYKADLKKEPWREPQNGSTFFKSGYIDYLDANYTPPTDKPPKPPTDKNKFNQFTQNSYDFEALEQDILSN